MDPGDSNSNAAKESAASGAASPALARGALVLSIFAFLPPLGLAAIVMGHVAERHAVASPQNGRSMARAALWIAYIQLLVVVSATLIFWKVFHQTAQSFQRDGMVQSFFRSSDRDQPLDPGEVAEVEHAARTILTQLIAIEDQYRRDSKNGLYACRLYELIEGGLEGTTQAERRAFYQRVVDSPYIFEISYCNSGDVDSKEAAYFLTAVPRHPRMPEWSAIYCADQSGAIRQVRTGTSLDCLKHGDPLP